MATPSPARDPQKEDVKVPGTNAISFRLFRRAQPRPRFVCCACHSQTNTHSPNVPRPRSPSHIRSCPKPASYPQRRSPCADRYAQCLEITHNPPDNPNIHKDDKMPPQDAPAVRFASSVEEITPTVTTTSPTETLSPTDAATGDGEETLAEVTPDQIRALSKSLQGAPLQQRRMNVFGFEPYSLPASRVSSLFRHNSSVYAWSRSFLKLFLVGLGVRPDALCFKVSYLPLHPSNTASTVRLVFPKHLTSSSL